MSKAFTRETDADGVTETPERVISAFPNLVTREGLAAIAAEVTRWSRVQTEALDAGDREEAQRAARELRYWTARSQTAQVAPAHKDDETVRFGSTVTLERIDGRRNTWRIVGEDEADPAQGLLSHASPLARAMLGRSVGDTVEAGAVEAEIVSVTA